MDEVVRTDSAENAGVVVALLAHPWFKTFSITCFMAIFFTGYFYLLRHPAFPVRTIPETAVDRWIGFQPLALPVYLSLWIYVSLPVALMLVRADIVRYGVRMAALCVAGFAVFYIWPNAIEPANIDWSRYPGVAFLKTVDTSGNALPSLHVATAVFSGCWLHWRARRLQLGTPVLFGNMLWCAAIAWSTLAIKQHVALDVLAGAAFGAAFAGASGLKASAARVPIPAAGPNGEHR